MFSWITFLLICSFASLNHGGMHNDTHMGMQYHMHAKEAIIKTFEIDNYVIDCIDIYKQPAFQHPLLVNHTIQLKPNHPSKTNGYVEETSHPWNSSKSCPQGSIPIERIQRNGQFLGNILKSHSHKHPNYFLGQKGMPEGSSSKVHEHAIIRSSGDKFFGGKATLNVWNPKIDGKDTFSLAQIWLTTESYQDWLEAGWTVFPSYYGSAEPRFFIFRTADNYRTTGCYNLDCPGFVQTNRHTILGTFLRPVSVYGGQQYAVDIEIFKDRTSGNWWVRRQGVEMGYWPKELVPSLAEGATYADFGGEVSYDNSGGHTSTEMGSGHFPYEGFRRSSFFKNVQVLDTSYAYQTPGHIKALMENSGYYDLQVGREKHGPWGLFFFFGGPGRSEKCT